MRSRPSRLRRQVGQTMVIAALVLPVMLGISAVAIDVGANFADQRALQRASDSGALAGASNLRNGKAATLQAAQTYAWRDLDQSVPSSVATTCSSSVSTCKIGPVNGYTVTATNPYTPHNTTYSSKNVVSVDITHVNPAVGFEAAIGFPSVTISVHAAATAKSGFVNFPFALATRFLDLTGNGAITAYGAVLVGQCDDGGAGDLADGGSNGGIRFGGAQSELDLAGSYDSSGNVASAQAALVQVPNKPVACTSPGTATDASGSWTTFGGNVSFSPTASNYNYFYGFNSGPANCSSATSTGCTGSTTGGNGWQDSCWVSGSKTVPVNTSSGSFTASSSGVGTITAGTNTACNAGNSHEGSYTEALTLPPYSTPADLAQSAGDPPDFGKSGTTLSGGGGGTTSVSANQRFTNVNNNNGANYSFSPGWYIFDGSNASLSMGNNGGLTCKSGISTHPSGYGGINGCVFIFVNGADLTGSQSTINCADSIDNAGNCSFQFSSTTSNGSVGSLKLGSSTNVTAHPITFTDSGRTLRYPLIYSTQVASSLNCSNSPCAVYLSQSGSTFDVRGTFYAPYGVTSFNANAAPVSGQIVADTIQLQSGASASGNGVAYNGSAVAPAALPAQLIE